MKMKFIFHKNFNAENGISISFKNHEKVVSYIMAIFIISKQMNLQ